MLQIIKTGQGSVILRVKVRDSTSTTGGGLTGLTNASSGLIISTIADNEAAATVYTVAASHIQTIATLGTYAAPSASNCRFKEVDATNHKGVYEIQIADARFAVAGAKSMLVSLSGATNMVETDALVPLWSIDPYTAPGANGGIMAVGTNAGPVTITGGLTISNSGGDAFTITASGSNGNGIVIAANGTGSGIKSTPGATGHGILTSGGATAGSGIKSIAPGNGHGIFSNGGASANNFGIYALGGSSGFGDGIRAQGVGNLGNGFSVYGGTNGYGFDCVGNGTGKAIAINDSVGNVIQGNIQGNMQGIVEGNAAIVGNAFVGVGAQANTTQVASSTTAASRLSELFSGVLVGTVDTGTLAASATVFETSFILSKDYFTNQALFWKAGSANPGVTSRIASVLYTGNNKMRFTLQDALPNTPLASDPFLVFGKIDG